MPPVVLRSRVWVLAVLAAAAGPSPAGAENAAARPGLFVTVPNPLNSDAVKRIKNRIEPARNAGEKRPSVVVFDFNPNDKDAATPDFGACYDLAEYIAGLHDLQTEAWVHRKVSGHTVLPVMACKGLVVGPQAVIGEVRTLADPPLKDLPVAGYTSILKGTRPAHLAVVRKMFDPDVQLRKGRKGGADWYVDDRVRAEAEKLGVVVSDTSPPKDLPDNSIAVLKQAQLLSTKNGVPGLGLAQREADTRQEVVEALDLAQATLREDPLNGRAPAAFRYVLRGPIDQGVREGVRRVVEKVVREKGNVLFLQLECAGGDWQAARDLADDLRKFSTAEGDEAILIVAVVPDKAPDTAAAVALGCTEIVMSKRKDAPPSGGDVPAEAEFGDFEGFLGKKGQQKNVDGWVGSLRQLAEEQGYSPLLVEGMLRKDLEIVRVRARTDRTKKRLMTAEEFAADKANWETDSVVKVKGQYLKLPAARAEELGIARHTTETRDPAEVYAKYGVDPTKVKDATPAWLDKFANFLKIPGVTVLLVVIGFTGLILELKVPGTIVPGIVAAMCFILVFWAHTQFSGQMAALAGLLFVFGLVLVLMEVFVLPGFGVAGITGVLLILSSLALVTLDKIPQTGGDWGEFGGKVATFLFAIIGATFGAFYLSRFLPQIPGANRLLLAPPGDAPGDLAEYALPGATQAAGLLGAVGTTVTVLRPAGSVQFGDQFVDVVSDGGYIPAGARVQVVEVEGTRIVVKEM